MPAKCLLGHSWFLDALCKSLICKSYHEADDVHAVDNIRLLMYLSMCASALLEVQDTLAQLIVKRKAGVVMRRCFHASMLKKEICSEICLTCDETFTCALRRCGGKVGAWGPAYMGRGECAPGDGDYEGPVSMQCEPASSPQRRLSEWIELVDFVDGVRSHWVMVCSIACMNQAQQLRDSWPGPPGWCLLRGTRLLSIGEGRG